MKRYLVLDISNVLYRTFFANKSEDDTTIGGLAHHCALTTINKYFKQFQPHKIIMTFDRPNWRKEYTESDQCISGKIYKGHRRQKMTPSEKAKYERFKEHLTDFENMMREHTSVVCCAGDGLEADDLVALFVQMHPDDELIVVSGDKDLMQLLDHDNIRLIDPATGKDRTLDEWGGDRDLFIFEKCFRGDAGDNVQSALPRIKKTRIMKAYNDPFERANVMNETWIHPVTGKEMVVKHLFKENELLMDLTQQPDEVRKNAIKIILKEMDNPGKYSYFHFMKFLGKYELKKIASQAELFAPMLSR